MRQSLQSISFIGEGMKPSYYRIPALMRVGKLESMYGELTSISNMDSDQDLNPRPYDCRAYTLTTTPSCLPNMFYYTHLPVMSCIGISFYFFTYLGLPNQFRYAPSFNICDGKAGLISITHFKVLSHFFIIGLH